MFTPFIDQDGAFSWSLILALIVIMHGGCLEYGRDPGGGGGGGGGGLQSL